MGPLFILLLGLGSGCANTVHTTQLDAKGAADVAHYAEGGGVVLALDPANRDLVCALPTSEDAAGPRETSRFLEVALYRLCEAHANGLLGGTCDAELGDVEAAPDGSTRNAAMKAYSECMSSCDPARDAVAERLDHEREAARSLAHARKNVDLATAATSKLQRENQLDKQLLSLATKRASAKEKPVQDELDLQIATAREERTALTITEEERASSSLLGGYRKAVKDAQAALASARESKKMAEQSLSVCEASLQSGYERTFKLLLKTNVELEKLRKAKTKKVDTKAPRPEKGPAPGETLPRKQH